MHFSRDDERAMFYHCFFVRLNKLHVARQYGTTAAHSLPLMPNSSGRVGEQHVLCKKCEIVRTFLGL
jgi:hypothetical protein